MHTQTEKKIVVVVVAGASKSFKLLTIIYLQKPLVLCKRTQVEEGYLPDVCCA